MFGIGMPEMILILAIALIVIGPKKLPDLAKSLGRAFAEFKRATAELKESMDIDYDLDGVKKTFEGMKDELKDAVDLNKGFEPVDQQDDTAHNDDKTLNEAVDMNHNKSPLPDENERKKTSDIKTSEESATHG